MRTNWERRILPMLQDPKSSLRPGEGCQQRPVRGAARRTGLVRARFPRQALQGVFPSRSEPKAVQTLLSPLHGQPQGLGRSRRFVREGWKWLFLPNFLQNLPALAGKSSAIHRSWTQPQQTSVFSGAQSPSALAHLTVCSHLAPGLLPVLMGNNIYFNQQTHM